MRPNKLIADACYGNAGVFLHEGECPDSLFRARTVCQKTAFYATKRNIKGEWRRGRAKTRARAGVRGRKRGGRGRRGRSGPAAVPRVGRPDAAPCAAIGGARRHPPQHSQRVLLAKPRTTAVSRRGRCGAAARGRPSSEGRGRENCAGVMAVGREPGGPAADHRAARVMRVGNGGENGGRERGASRHGQWRGGFLTQRNKKSV